jgi:hypothetical protein
VRRPACSGRASAQVAAVTAVLGLGAAGTAAALPGGAHGAGPPTAPAAGSGAVGIGKPFHQSAPPLVRLASLHRCAARGAPSLRVGAPTGERVTLTRVSIGRRALAIGRRAAPVTVVLPALPHRRFILRLRLRIASGGTTRAVRVVRRYGPCTPEPAFTAARRVG